MADVCCSFEANACSIEDTDDGGRPFREADLNSQAAKLTNPMPVFIAFAAFLLLVFGHRFGLPIRSWVVTGEPFGTKRK